jgi:K+-transporting ATPase ATPase A chain
MGYLVQLAGLTVQNFVSAAVGIAVAIALVRGFARRGQARSATSGSTSRAASADLLPMAVSPPSCCWPAASSRT